MAEAALLQNYYGVVKGYKESDIAPLMNHLLLASTFSNAHRAFDCSCVLCEQTGQGLTQSDVTSNGGKDLHP